MSGLRCYKYFVPTALGKNYGFGEGVGTASGFGLAGCVERGRVEAGREGLIRSGCGPLGEDWTLIPIFFFSPVVSAGSVFCGPGATDFAGGVR